MCSGFITFEGNITLFYELATVAIAQEGTSACSPKNNFRNTKFLNCIEGEAHGTIGNNVRNSRKFLDEFVEVTQAGFGRVAERWNVLGGINISWRETIGDGLNQNDRRGFRAQGPLDLRKRL